MNRAILLFPGVMFLWLAGSLAAPLGAFTVNPDGTVTDPATGLLWDRCSWGQTWDGANACNGSASVHTWQTALGTAVTANAANHRGYSDWRLPNRTELESLVDITKATAPTIDTAAFPSTPSFPFWSSTPYATFPVVAWYADFFNGSISAAAQSSNYRVRLVRSGQSFDALALTATPDPTPIPVMGGLGVLLLGAGLGLLGLLGFRRRA